MADSLRSLFKHYELTDVQETGKELGKGAYGVVVELNYNGLRCAGKKLHPILLQTNAEERMAISQRFVEECIHHSHQRHPNVVQLLGVHFSPGEQLPMLVMELMHMSLSECLKHHPNLPIQLKNEILVDVARGLVHLHGKTLPIIHRDLTANNVLLTPHLTAKITDLGVARINPDKHSQTLTQVPGTMAYMPPEALAAKPTYTTKLDIFSMGVLILHTLIDMCPLPGDAVEDLPGKDGLCRRISETDRRKQYLVQIEEEPHKSLVNKCLHNVPDDRPTASEVLKQLETIAEGSGKMSTRLQLIMSLDKKNRELASKEEEKKQLITAKNYQIQIKEDLVMSKIKLLQKQDEEIQDTKTELKRSMKQVQETEAELHTTKKKLKTAQELLQRKEREIREQWDELQRTRKHVKDIEIQLFQLNEGNQEVCQPKPSVSKRVSTSLTSSTAPLVSSSQTPSVPANVSAQHSETGYIGLKPGVYARNGSLISLLQLFYMTPEFRNAIYRWNLEQGVQGPNESLLYQLQRLFVLLQVSSKHAISTTGIVNCISLNTTSRYDLESLGVHDFYQVVLDIVEKDTTRSKNNQFIQDLVNKLFEGTLQDYVQCLTCGSVSSRKDTFRDIPLVIKSVSPSQTYNSVEESLKAFVKPEILKGKNKYLCSKCNEKQDACKLKRFQIDSANKQIKLNDRMTFPRLLDLNDFIDKQNMPDPDDNIEQTYRLFKTDNFEKEAKDILENDCSPIIPMLLRGPHVYELYCIFVHSGKAYGGEYYAYIKSLVDKNWYCFNDRTVTQIQDDDINQTFGSTSTLMEYFFSSSQSTIACMLTYRKVEKDRNETFMGNSHVLQCFGDNVELQ